MRRPVGRYTGRFTPGRSPGWSLISLPLPKKLLIAALFQMSNADRFEFPPVNLNSVLGFEYYDLRVLPLPDRLA